MIGKEVNARVGSFDRFCKSFERGEARTIGDRINCITPHSAVYALQTVGKKTPALIYNGLRYILIHWIRLHWTGVHLRERRWIYITFE